MESVPQMVLMTVYDFRFAIPWSQVWFGINHFFPILERLRGAYAVHYIIPPMGPGAALHNQTH